RQELTIEVELYRISGQVATRPGDFSGRLFEAQLFVNFDDTTDCLGQLVGRRVAAQAESQRGIAKVLREAHRDQRRRGLARAAGTGRTPRTGDPSQVQSHRHRLAVDIAESDVRSLRQAAASRAVYDQLRAGRQQVAFDVVA